MANHVGLTAIYLRLHWPRDWKASSIGVKDVLPFGWLETRALRLQLKPWMPEYNIIHLHFSNLRALLPMLSQDLSSSAITCAEHIAFLHQLHVVPSPPSRNRLGNAISRHDNYDLPIELEDKLSDTLAFLAGVTKDSQHVPAIALAERDKSSRLEVILAVNKESYGDGEAVLQKTKSHFEEIFNVLARVMNRDPQTPTRQAEAEMAIPHERLVFTKIVSMCADRILCRLRLAPHHYNKPKQPLKSVLNETINALEQLKLNKDMVSIASIDLFTFKARAVIKQIELWQKYHASSRLEALVDSVYDLKQIEELPTLLTMITNKMMGPSSKKNLSNIINKVARYREAARFLYRKAKKHHLVRNMSVVLAKLPREAFKRVSAPHCAQSLISIIPRYTPSRKPEKIASIHRLLVKDTRDANGKFLKQTMATLKAKIHAEIQIFAHCRLNDVQPPPRVICSSKDACFLCNSFIGLQRKVYVPRSHGRLYPGWRLPLLAEFHGLQNVFNKHLQKTICTNIQSQLSMPKRVLYPDPNESTTFTLPLSNTTICSTLATNVNQANNFSPPSPSQGIPTGSMNEALETDSKKSFTPTSRSLELSPDDSTSASLISRRDTFSDMPHPDNPVIVKDNKFSALIQLDAAPLVFRYESFELQVEYSREDWQSKHSNESKYALLTAKWLASEEMANLKEVDKENTIDSGLLNTGVEHVLDGSRCFCLRVKESLVRISIQYMGEEYSTSLAETAVNSEKMRKEEEKIKPTSNI